mgnify:CR=1 FL=1
MKSKTTIIKERDNNWVVVDAADQSLGRLAAAVAIRLMGKHRACYTPTVDTGDHVVVTNASKVTVGGNNAELRTYSHYTGFPGGLKVKSYREMMEKNPSAVIEQAVKRMLPKGPMGKRMFRKLHVFAAAEHTHQAQQPVSVKI